MQLQNCRLLIPDSVHIASHEGGHLVVATNRHVSSRRDFTASELLATGILSIVGSLTLETAFNSAWTNYQENGNWSIGSTDAHAHLHVYGRHPTALEQAFGEALLFPIGDERSDWQVKQLTRREVGQLRCAAELLRHAPVVDRLRMALDQLT